MRCTSTLAKQMGVFRLLASVRDAHCVKTVEQPATCRGVDGTTEHRLRGLADTSGVLIPIAMTQRATRSIRIMTTSDGTLAPLYVSAERQ